MCVYTNPQVCECMYVGGGGHQVKIVHNEFATDLIGLPSFSVSMTTHSSEERLRRTGRGSTTLSNCSP